MSSERAETMMVEEGGGDVAVRWEKFLPTSSVRVLLVESDDSTRQIIAALLRKCGYKVFAASDGVKAWETLKDKSHNIDLVLSEVELPSISGFSLLTMIMDHEACKSISVIMMSSQDSINLVFKCMLKGAADFLVKPIRKNELRNLWQHVWRKNISNSQQRSTNEHRDENLAKRKLDDCSRRHINCMRENQECSEKGSDAQSSCTRSDMEAESTCPQSILDDKQRRNMDIPVKNDTIPQAGEKHIRSDCLMSMNDHEADDNTTSMSAKVERSPLNGNCSFNEPTPKECTFQIIENVNKDAHSKEIVDLLGVIDNQPRRSDLRRNVITVSDASEVLLNEKEGKCGLRPTPFLELSLRRYQQGTCGKSENDESNSLKHSNSSAFSLYSSRPVLPTSSTFMNSGNECKEHWSTTIRNQTVPDSDNATDAPSCNGAAATNINEEDSISLGMKFGSRGGMAVHHSSQRAVPFSIPVRETTSDRFCEGYGTIPPPIYYPQAAHPLWNVVPSMWQQGMNPMRNHHEDEQSPKSKHEEDKVHGDEQRHASSVTVESGSSSLCIVSGSNLNIDGSSHLCERSEGNVAAVNISDAHTLKRNIEDQFNHEANKPSDLHCPSQREAALNKFRLKRKDRCFEKKVRYHSRKRLAEQRPRVKGQFVRQVLPQS